MRQRRDKGRDRSSGFTLIELLVVISIIALLSSVVLSSLNSAREKARLAAGMQFAASSYHAMGAGMTGAWTFEEGAGSMASDSSGGGNTGTLVSASWDASTYGQGSRSAVSFAGAHYVRIDSPLGISTGDFSISLWVKTLDAGGQRYVFSNTASADGFRFGLSAGRVAFLIGNGSSYVESTCGTRSFNDGKWHHIMGVFNRATGTFECYGDGSAAGTAAAAVSGEAIADGQSRIGAPICCGSSFTGSVDDARVYAQALTASDARALYAEGLEQRVLAGMMGI